jgi:hypothetical protein
VLPPDVSLRRPEESPALALSLAFDDTLRLLFQPFDGHQWITLSLVCLLLGGGTSSAAFNWSLGALPTDAGYTQAITELRYYIAERLWLLILTIALGIAVGILVLYCRATFRFVLVDSLIHKKVRLRAAWSGVQPVSLSYFRWLLGSFAAAGTTLGVSIIVFYPFLRSVAAAGPHSIIAPVILAAVLVSVVVGGGLLALLISLTDDLVVPLMYSERLLFLPAWRRLLGIMKAHVSTFALYILVRFLASVVIGAVALFLLFPVLVGFFSGAIIAATVVVLGLRLLGIFWFWNPITIVLAACGLLVLTALLLILLSVVGMPGQVLLQDYGMRIMTPHSSDLDRMWQWPIRPRPTYHRWNPSQSH